MKNTTHHNNRQWYLPLITGLLFVLLGVWVFSTPLESYITLAIFFALIFVISGIIEIIHALSNTKTIHNWGWLLVGGILNLLIGFMLLTVPGLTMVALPFYIAFTILFRSIMSIGWSINLNKAGVPGWGWLLFIAITGVVLSLIMIGNPILAGLTIVFYTAAALVVAGVLQVLLSFKLRNIGKG